MTCPTVAVCCWCHPLELGARIFIALTLIIDFIRIIVQSVYIYELEEMEVDEGVLLPPFNAIKIMYLLNLSSYVVLFLIDVVGVVGLIMYKRILLLTWCCAQYGRIVIFIPVAIAMAIIASDDAAYDMGDAAVANAIFDLIFSTFYILYAMLIVYSYVVWIKPESLATIIQKARASDAVAKQSMVYDGDHESPYQGVYERSYHGGDDGRLKDGGDVDIWDSEGDGYWRGRDVDHWRHGPGYYTDDYKDTDGDRDKPEYYTHFTDDYDYTPDKYFDDDISRDDNSNDKPQADYNRVKLHLNDMRCSPDYYCTPHDYFYNEEDDGPCCVDDNTDENHPDDYHSGYQEDDVMNDYSSTQHDDFNDGIHHDDNDNKNKRHTSDDRYSHQE